MFVSTGGGKTGAISTASAEKRKLRSQGCGGRRCAGVCGWAENPGLTFEILAKGNRLGLP